MLVRYFITTNCAAAPESSITGSHTALWGCFPASLGSIQPSAPHGGRALGVGFGYGKGYGVVGNVFTIMMIALFIIMMTALFIIMMTCNIHNHDDCTIHNCWFRMLRFDRTDTQHSRFCFLHRGSGTLRVNGYAVSTATTRCLLSCESVLLLKSHTLSPLCSGLVSFLIRKCDNKTTPLFSPRGFWDVTSQRLRCQYCHHAVSSLLRVGFAFKVSHTRFWVRKGLRGFVTLRLVNLQIIGLIQIWTFTHYSEYYKNPNALTCVLNAYMPLNTFLTTPSTLFVCRW